MNQGQLDHIVKNALFLPLCPCNCLCVSVFMREDRERKEEQVKQSNGAALVMPSLSFSINTTSLQVLD